MKYYVYSTFYFTFRTLKNQVLVIDHSRLTQIGNLGKNLTRNSSEKGKGVLVSLKKCFLPLVGIKPDEKGFAMTEAYDNRFPLINS